MKISVLFTCLFISLYAYSQESDSKLEFYSISFSPLSVYSDDHGGGISLNLDLAFNVDKHIIKACILSGSEVNILGRSHGFTEISTLYGQKLLQDSKVFKFDTFAGFGYFRFTYPDKSITSDNAYLEKKTISIPIQTRLRFQTGKSFSLGLQLHYSINAVNAVFNASMLLQWYI